MRQLFIISAITACLAVTILCVVSDASGQAAGKAAREGRDPVEIRSSAAYAEVLLRKTELQAETEGLAAEYTDEFPKLAEARYALEAVERERLRLLSLKPAAASRLTLALGKLMVRKAEQEVELWTLRKSLQEGHPDVKRAKRKVEIYEAAIKEILG